MLDMANKQIIPAVMAFSGDIADGINNKTAAGVKPRSELDLLKKVSGLTDSAYDAANKLADIVVEAKGVANVKDAAFFYRDNVLPAMQELRLSCDALEMIVDKDYWPIPVYGDLLFW